jgi:formylglycine-generating enzyme required for sulfatase activity
LLYAAACAAALVLLLCYAILEEFHHGWIKVTLSEPGAAVDVVLDGKPIATGGLNEPIRLTTGEHHLRVAGSSYQPWSRTFTVQHGSNPALTVPLAPIAPPSIQPAPPPVVEPEFLTTRLGQIKLKRIPAGTFRMGSPDDDKDVQSNEKPQREVRISRPFYLGVFEVTQAQYHAVTGQNPSYFSSTGGGRSVIAGQSTDQHPVETFSWLEAVRFCNTLSEREGLKPFYEIDADNVQVPDWNGTGYRLPTEAEWEYACRAGSTTRYGFGDDQGELSKYAWFGKDLEKGTHAVGQKQPNAFGLYDMHGNVWEWCWDWYNAEYYKQMLNINPTGPPTGTDRVLRGGSFRNLPANLRSAFRTGIQPALRIDITGFRLARTFH